MNLAIINIPIVFTVSFLISYLITLVLSNNQILNINVFSCLCMRHFIIIVTHILITEYLNSYFQVESAVTINLFNIHSWKGLGNFIVETTYCP